MNDRRALLLAGLVLVLVVLGVGAVWLMNGGEGGTSPLAAVDGVRGGEAGAPADEARDPIPLDHPDPIPMTVYMSPTCGCCGLWVEHAEEHGFEPEIHLQADMAEVKRTFGVPMALASCHTAVVNGYVMEGHIPGEDVRRFLAEAPPARGLAVPRMPVGSPGMEMESGRVDPYEVLLFRSDGETEVFSRHGPAR